MMRTATDFQVSLYLFLASLIQVAIEKKMTLFIDDPTKAPGLEKNEDWAKFGYGYYVGAPSGWQDKPRVGQQYLSYIALEMTLDTGVCGCVLLCGQHCYKQILQISYYHTCKQSLPDFCPYGLCTKQAVSRSLT